MKHEIPPQHEGRQMDATKSVSFALAIEAQHFYYVVCDRILAIDNWHAIAKLPMASFTHLDNGGRAISRAPKEGDYIQIDIPGPGLANTDGYDYVKVERIDESKEEHFQALTLTLRPCSSPLDQSDVETKHFFQNIATSTLQILRVENSIHAHYFGRNEVLNLDVLSFSDKLRNFVIGIGAKLGASFPQWESLLTGLLDTNIPSPNDSASS